MTGTIFDFIEKDIPEGQEGYFEIAKHAPKLKEKSFLNDVSDYAKTALKGGIEGLSRLGQMVSPLQEYPKRTKEGGISLGRTSQEQLEEQSENLDVLLPTEESYGKSALRRGLRELPSATAFPGATLATLPRAIAAGFLGEGAKELGAPEWAQTAAEMTAYIGPDVTKKLLSSGKDKELIDFGRKMGISDESLTPLLQSEFKQKWLSKLTPRRGSTASALAKSKGELSEAYNAIKKSDIAKSGVAENVSNVMLHEFKEKLFDMPSSVRKSIKNDLRDLISKPITGESLINFWSDINHELGPNTKQLSILKPSIQKALQKTSPELAKDFKLINDLHTRYYPIAGRLKPNLTTDIISAAEALGLGASALFGLSTGYFPGFLHILGEKTAKKIAQKSLLDPRFQQLSKKMVVALNQNKYNLAKKVSTEMIKQISNVDREAAETLSELNDQELEEFFKSHLQK